MYTYFFRPILFLFSAESVHSFTVGLLRFAGKLPGAKFVMRTLFSYRHPSLEREVLGIRFPNPIGLAAGFDKNGEVFREMAALGFGFVEVGTVTPKPQKGNAKPRLFRLKADEALINRMGFNNKGLENMLENLQRRGKRPVIGCNLGRNTLTSNEDAPADYLLMFRKLYRYADYFVVNVSCPNVGGVTALQNRESVMAILGGLFEFRKGQGEYRPLLLKISPDLGFEQIDAMVDIMMDTPLDGMVAVNTTTRRDNLNTPAQTIEEIGAGGLSGKPLTGRAVEVIRHINKRTEGRYPIIGAGGVMTPQDAQDMLDAGASLVQVYTGMVYGGPSFAGRICRYIRTHVSGLK